MHDNLKSLFTQHWEYLAIQTACKTNILDYIAEGSNSIEAILLRRKFNKAVLINLIDALDQSGILMIDGQLISLTDKGLVLTENHSRSLKYACIHWGEEHLTAWQNLEYTLTTGKSAFEYIYKETMFDYLSSRNDKLVHYHKAMDEYARDDYINICTEIDFSEYSSVMDIGGGLGALIANIAKNNNESKCFLFDRPEVIDLVNRLGFECVKGDFFKEIPYIAETILMSRVLHDWDDKEIRRILSSVHSSLPEKGTLFLIENLTDMIQNKASYLSLNMHIITKSYERSSKEYFDLLKQSNFEVVEIIQINQLQYAIKSKKI